MQKMAVPFPFAVSSADSKHNLSVSRGSSVSSQPSILASQNEPRRASPTARHGHPESASGVASSEGSATALQPATKAAPCAAAIPTRVPL